MKERTIFSDLFEMPKSFSDRHVLEPELEPVDVIIPVINTNPLFRRNLYNLYQRVPVRQLLIGDGGSTDGSIDIVREFPRVKIIDQRKYKTLGKCLAELMDNVESEWFVYVHADVFLPEGWYDEMSRHRQEYDWFESSQKNVVLSEYWSYDHKNVRQRRAYSGAQMGRKDALQKITRKLDDDYSQRQEDAIFACLLEDAGFKYGRVSDTFIHHQIMNKMGEMEPKIKSVSIAHEEDREWTRRVYDMQIRGFIKYTKPNEDTCFNVSVTLDSMAYLEILDEKELLKWTSEVNPVWLSYVQEHISISRDYQRILRARVFLRNLLRRILRAKNAVMAPMRLMANKR